MSPFRKLPGLLAGPKPLRRLLAALAYFLLALEYSGARVRIAAILAPRPC